jgi:hypothetical protein
VPIRNVSSVQFGAYQGCTPKVQQQIAVEVQLCDRAGSNWYCSDRARPPVRFDVLTFIRADAYAPCSRGTHAYY